MPKNEYDILKATFDIYCQRDFESPEALQRHILAAHRNTYAYNAVIEARKVRKEVARLKAKALAKPVQQRPARKQRKHD